MSGEDWSARSNETLSLETAAEFLTEVERLEQAVEAADDKQLARIHARRQRRIYSLAVCYAIAAPRNLSLQEADDLIRKHRRQA